MLQRTQKTWGSYCTPTGGVRVAQQLRGYSERRAQIPGRSEPITPGVRVAAPSLFTRDDCVQTSPALQSALFAPYASLAARWVLPVTLSDTAGATPDVGAAGCSCIATAPRVLPSAPRITDDITIGDAVAMIQQWIKSFPTHTVHDRDFIERVEKSFERGSCWHDLSDQRARYLLRCFITCVQGDTLPAIRHTIQTQRALAKLRTPGVTFEDFRQIVTNYRDYVASMIRDHTDLVATQHKQFAQFDAAVKKLEVDTPPNGLLVYARQVMALRSRWDQLPTGGVAVSQTSRHSLGDGSFSRKGRSRSGIG